MSELEKSKGLLESFWSALDSMKFGVFLLTVLTLVSLAGVLLPQFPPDGFSGTIEEFYLQKYGPAFGGVFIILGLQHLFTVWWYYLLLFVLCLNLTVCSLRRLKGKIRELRSRRFLEEESAYRNFRNSRTIELHLPPEKAAGEIVSLLKSSGYRVFAGEGPDQARLALGRKGAVSRLGPFMAHFSLVIIILGAALSAMLSFQHFQWLAPGQVIEVPDLGYLASPGYLLSRVKGRLLGAFGSPGRTSGPERSDLLIRYADWRVLPDSLHLRTLFRLRLDRFEVLFTPQGAPKAYLSTVTVMGPSPGDSALFSQVIKVNDPLVHRGVYFYQNSYSASSEGPRTVDLTVSANESAVPSGYRVKLSQSSGPAPLGVSGDSIRLESFTGTFQMDARGRVQDIPGEDRNPAAEVVIFNRDGELMRAWVFKNFPGFSHGADQPYSLTLNDYEKTYSTGLSIRTHRSQSLVWLGFALLVLGTLVSFYVNYRQVWIMVRPGGEGPGSLISAAGVSSKWKEPFREEFRLLCSRIESLDRSGSPVSAADGPEHGPSQG